MDIFFVLLLEYMHFQDFVCVCVVLLRLWLAFLMTLPEYFVVILDKLLF